MIVRTFRYKRTLIKYYLGFIITILGAFCLFIPLWKPKGWPGGGIFFVAVFILLGLLFINGCFMTSDVEIGPGGISWLLHGWRWKSMKWTDVRNIRILQVWDFTQHKNVKNYYLYQTDKPRAYFLPKGGMGFSDAISEVEQLKSLIRSYINDLHVPIIGLRSSDRLYGKF